MSDLTTIEHINKLEAVALASNMPTHDGINALLNEGRQGAYSSSSSIDVSDPGNVTLKTTVRDGAAPSTDSVYHGSITTSIGALPAETIISGALTFADEKGNAVRTENLATAIDPKQLAMQQLAQDRDAAGKVTMRVGGQGQMFLANGQHQTVFINQITDAGGKVHMAVDFTTSSDDSKKSVSDNFVFKDGITADDVNSGKIRIPGNLIGVVHTSKTSVDDKTDVEVSIDSARYIGFPPLYKP